MHHSRTRPHTLHFLTLWLGLTALAFTIDAPLRTFFENGWGEHILAPALNFVYYMGQYPIHLLVLALLVGSPRRWRAMLEYAALMLGATLVSTALKYAIGRARPETHLGIFHFAPFSGPGRGMNSFPSGDAVAAMALATLLGIYFPRSRWLFWVLGAWAALGRVALTKHFLSDVVFGAGLGIACVWVGLALLRRCWPEPTPSTPAPVTAPVNFVVNT